MKFNFLQIYNHGGRCQVLLISVHCFEQHSISWTLILRLVSSNDAQFGWYYSLFHLCLPESSWNKITSIFSLLWNLFFLVYISVLILIYFLFFYLAFCTVATCEINAIRWFKYGTIDLLPCFFPFSFLTDLSCILVLGSN